MAIFCVWIQIRKQCVLDLYFCGLTLATINTLKGRFNSTRRYSALGSNKTLWFSAFCIWALVGNYQCAILLNVPFWNSLTVSDIVHFVHFNANYSTSLVTPVLIYSVFFILLFVSIIWNTPLHSLLESKIWQVMFFSLASRPLVKPFQKH